MQIVAMTLSHYMPEVSWARRDSVRTSRPVGVLAPLETPESTAGLDCRYSCGCAGPAEQREAHFTGGQQIVNAVLEVT